MTAHRMTLTAPRGFVNQPGRRTYLLATAMATAGILAMTVLMIVGILLANPGASREVAPAPQPMPKPVLQLEAGR